MIAQTAIASKARLQADFVFLVRTRPLLYLKAVVIFKMLCSQDIHCSCAVARIVDA